MTKPRTSWALCAAAPPAPLYGAPGPQTGCLPAGLSHAGGTPAQVACRAGCPGPDPHPHVELSPLQWPIRPIPQRKKNQNATAPQSHILRVSMSPKVSDPYCGARDPGHLEQMCVESHYRRPPLNTCPPPGLAREEGRHVRGRLETPHPRFQVLALTAASHTQPGRADRATEVQSHPPLFCPGAGTSAARTRCVGRVWGRWPLECGTAPRRPHPTATPGAAPSGAVADSPPRSLRMPMVPPV